MNNQQMNIAIGILAFFLVGNYLGDFVQASQIDRLRERVVMTEKWLAALDTNVTNLSKTVYDQITDLYDFKNEMQGIVENLHQTDLAQRQKMEWLISELRYTFGVIWQRLR